MKCAYNNQLNPKIAFFSEGGFTGKLPRNIENLRVPEAWYVVTDSTHHQIGTQLTDETYDLGVIIIPKKRIDVLMQQNIIDNLRGHCIKLAIMQEGPHWFWQDYPIEQQVWYYNMLMDVDFLLAHNKADVQYYKGLTNKPTYRMPSVMVEDNIKNMPIIDRNGVMIGGNFCSWYGGFDSMVVANVFDEKIYLPSMGRKVPREEELDVNHLPYVNWTQWIYELNKRKYAVHLLRTHAAGTFSLNCAYLGIPCIGYKGLDTQDILHPHLSVYIGDMYRAKKLATKLNTDINFYNEMGELSKELYNTEYTEQKFLEQWNDILLMEHIYNK